MSQTIEAEVTGDGTVTLREPVRFDGPPRRAVVVIADAAAGPPPPAVSPPPVEVPIPMPVPPELVDEFMRRLRALATDCGVSLPDSAFTSEELYD